MPIGVIVNTLAIVIGGIAGALWGSKLSKEFKEKLNLVFGICSMGIGISSIFRFSACMVLCSLYVTIIARDKGSYLCSFTNASTSLCTVCLSFIV